MNDKPVSTAHSEPMLFIGKWTVRVLHLLDERPHRPAELRRHLGPISQRMLTRTLRNLEAAGLISREVSTARAAAVHYSLTELGKTFMVPMRSVCRWLTRHGSGLGATIRL